MYELALFAGIGGGLLGSRLLGWKPIAAVELNTYCRDILLKRQDEGYLEPFPIWDDIRTFNGRPFRGRVDIITAGFPCQGYSPAGHQQGAADSRNLWPDTLRVIREVEPKYILLENVPELLSYRYFSEVAGGLASSGYSFKWKVLSAAELGATHRRDRLWIVAHSNRFGLETFRSQIRVPEEVGEYSCEGWWICASGVPRVDDGIPDRVERTKGVGNAQVPGVARLAWSMLK